MKVPLGGVVFGLCECSSTHKNIRLSDHMWSAPDFLIAAGQNFDLANYRARSCISDLCLLIARLILYIALSRLSGLHRKKWCRSVVGL